MFHDEKRNQLKNYGRLYAEGGLFEEVYDDLVRSAFRGEEVKMLERYKHRKFYPQLVCMIYDALRQKKHLFVSYDDDDRHRMYPHENREYRKWFAAINIKYAADDLSGRHRYGKPRKNTPESLCPLEKRLMILKSDGKEDFSSMKEFENTYGNYVDTYTSDKDAEKRGEPNEEY